MAAWTIGGLYALVGAIQIAELGTMLPRSGGQYVFSRYALGEYPGFIVGWSDWLSTCGTAAAVSLVIAEFSGALFPVLARYQIALAVSIVMIFALAQWRGIREGSTVQNVTSAMKALAFAALVVASFVLGGGAAPSVAAAPTGLSLAVAFVLSLQAVIYTYDGWTGVIYFSEEVAKPDRDIPRSLIGGVLAIIANALRVGFQLRPLRAGWAEEPFSGVGQGLLDLAVAEPAPVIQGCHSSLLFGRGDQCVELEQVIACRVLGLLGLRLLGGEFGNGNCARTFNGHSFVMAGLVPAIHVFPPEI